ncbi:MAG TPA: methylmalonyl Co-A mutase-associated GTPase MeaB [Bryobacteraceae bacterium]|jgi:LAO/AO transport system kinase|nr:methylmalonyl Co-A mutase-associated GTPase MeaB [Bryobacteraceae bacterium]
MTLAERILSGDVKALARAATLIENGTEQGRELIREMFPHSGKALAAGITGPPGAGKSTLVDQLTRHLRAQGKRVGILAIDPSSKFSGGAILGDRIRMQEHSNDGGVFLRSLASRGGIGGLASATSDLVLLLDAASFDVVLVETVGVGQDEVEVAEVADVTVVVLAPGSGDDVQAIKAGILEIADVFAVNKSDLPGAELAAEQIGGAQSISVQKSKSDRAQVCRVSAREGTGIDALWQAIEAAASETGRKRRGVAVAGVEIDHIGIAVEKLESGLHFYQELLGMPLAGRETVDGERVHVAMLPAGNGNDSPRVELLEPTDEASPIARFLAKHGPGLHHIALRVPDLEASVDRLKREGALLLNEPREGAGGHRYVFVHPKSAGGVLLELIQK